MRPCIANMNQRRSPTRAKAASRLDCVKSSLLRGPVAAPAEGRRWGVIHVSSWIWGSCTSHTRSSTEGDEEQEDESSWEVRNPGVCVLRRQNKTIFSPTCAIIPKADEYFSVFAWSCCCNGVDRQLLLLWNMFVFCLPSGWAWRWPTPRLQTWSHSRPRAAASCPSAQSEDPETIEKCTTDHDAIWKYQRMSGWFTHRDKRGDNFRQTETKSDVADIFLWNSCLHEDIKSKNADLEKRGNIDAISFNVYMPVEL